jgi:hypothetical protein
MVVAVPSIWMMHVAFDDVVGMTAVRYRLMSATGTMSVLTVVRSARMSRGASGWIRATLRQGMLIDVPLVSTMKMPLMQIVDVTFVFNRGVPAAWTVRMGMLVVRFVVAHFIDSFRLLAFGSNSAIPTDCEFIFGRMRERVEHQLGNMPVCYRIIFVFPFTPARDESRVPKPSEPLGYGRNSLAHRFGNVADTGFMSAQDFHQSQAPFISDRS